MLLTNLIFEGYFNSENEGLPFFLHNSRSKNPAMYEISYIALTEASMKKVFLVVLTAGFLGGLAFAQSVNDFKIDLTKDGNGIIITGYTGTAAKVVIPAEIEGIPVRTIGETAFYKNRNITEVIIPDGVTAIADSRTVWNGRGYDGISSFRDCGNLTRVTLPNGLTKIGSGAFSGCDKLTTISIPDSVTEIGSRTFARCSSLASINIPDGVKILDSTFSYCQNLTSVNIPNSVTEIGKEAFSNCKKLTSITVPNSVTEIGDNAFEGCSGLTSIVLPASIKSISSRAFKDCTNLTSVTLEEGAVIRFSASSFSGCNKLDIKSQIALKKAGYGGEF
jgi:hypothetical protein